jgi:hypothetical protein
MKKDTHTSGPWHVGAGNGEGSIFSDNGRTRLGIGGTTLYSIAQITRGWNEAEDEANARLIAAAPEMLAALEELCADKYLADPINAGRMGKAKAAIAKVKGGEA